MRSNRLWLLLIALGVILSLAACAPKAKTVEEATPTSISEATTTEELEEETTTAEAPPEEVFTGSFDALKGLESYRYLSLFKFESKETAEITRGSIEIEGEYVAPDKEHATWTDLSSGEEFEVIRISDKAWIKQAGEWMEMPAEYAESLMQMIFMFGPLHSWDTLYTGLPGTSNLVGREVVNGIPCLHYASNYKGWEVLFGGGIAEARGEIWIAEEGFPVKYIFEASGTDTEGNQGSIEWSMELRDVNQPISIEPPM
jgi:hypothetical protein